MVELEHTRQMLGDMGLATAAELLDAHLEKAVHEEMTYIRFLEELLIYEQMERRRKSQETRLKMSRLPHRKTLEDFDFAFQPSIDKLMWIHCWLSLKTMSDVQTYIQKNRCLTGRCNWTAIFFPINSDLQSRSYRTFCVTQSKNCSPGIGVGASTNAKTTRFPDRKTGGFVNLGTRWHCLQGSYYAAIEYDGQ